MRLTRTTDGLIHANIPSNGRFECERLPLKLLYISANIADVDVKNVVVTCLACIANME